MSDIRWGVDALSLGWLGAVITNPPWSRDILHPMILHWLGTTECAWLLFDSDWGYTKQAAAFLPFCSDIVSVGRLRWIEDTKQTGYDNCSWYCFRPSAQKTIFHGMK